LSGCDRRASVFGWLPRGSASRDAPYDHCRMAATGCPWLVAAGCLFGRLSGELPERCGLFGAIAGAYACTVPATSADVIGREELLRAANP
jgi:hypothetical protein